MLTAGLAVSNPEGMKESSTEWGLIANQLDETKEKLQNAVLRGTDWIADDKIAFQNAVAGFKQEIDDAKTYVSNVSDLLDNIATGYVAFWVATAALAAVALAILIGLLALYFTPAGPAAKAYAEQVGFIVSRIVDVGTKALAAVAAAGTGILAVGGPLLLHLAGGKTGGETGREDFQKVVIEWQPTEFRAPKKEQPTTP